MNKISRYHPAAQRPGQKMGARIYDGVRAGQQHVLLGMSSPIHGIGLRSAQPMSAQMRLIMDRIGFTAIQSASQVRVRRQTKERLERDCHQCPSIAAAFAQQTPAIPALVRQLTQRARLPARSVQFTAFAGGATPLDAFELDRLRHNWILSFLLLGVIWGFSGFGKRSFCQAPRLGR